MSRDKKTDGPSQGMPTPPWLAALQRTLITTGVVLALGSCVLGSVWKSLFNYVPPGKVLVIITKTGKTPPPGQILAQPGEKGIQEEVLGEGRHFVLPVVNQVEIKDAVEIDVGQVGVVTAKSGTELRPGQVLADKGQKGIQRRVLPPGRHRLNPYGFTVDRRPCIVVRPGYVGFVTALVGKEAPQDRVFAEDAERGPRREVLPPGTYYLNPFEFHVEEVEVGINQVSFLEDHRLSFPSSDAFPITLEATVEWELHPDAVPAVMKEFGTRAAIEEKVIVPEAKSIGRIAGSRYAAKDFLLGEGREKFQNAFSEELIKDTREKHVDVHSAFIRHIEIPVTLRKPIQEAFISVQKEKTAKFWEDTRKTAGDLEREKAMIVQREQEVAAQTTAILAKVNAQAGQDVGKIEAETRRLVADMQKEIALLDAQRTLALGQAQASVSKKVGEAKAQLFGLKVGAFGGDATAFRHYTFAESLSADLKIRLVQSGPGTLWTDLGTAGLDEAAKAKILKGK